MTTRRAVSDMSGFCRHSGHHHLCRGTWTTPSADVTCECPCHASRVMVAKGPRAEAQAGVGVKKLVPKS